MASDGTPLPSLGSLTPEGRQIRRIRCTILHSHRHAAFRAAAPCAWGSPPWRPWPSPWGGFAAPGAVAAPTSNATLISTFGGKCLDAKDMQSSNGTPLQQWQCYDGSTAQMWRLLPDNGSYKIVLNSAQWMSIDVKDLNRGNGAKLQLWAFGGGANQRWRVNENADGTVNFLSVDTGKCLDIPEGRTDNGLLPHMWDCNGGPNQKFRIGKPGSTGGGGTTAPAGTLKDTMQALLSSAENSTLQWNQCYRYIEEYADHRGYTGGIVGFTSGTGDMIEVVERYKQLNPGAELVGYLGALYQVRNSDDIGPLGGNYVNAWKRAANSDARFRQAQDAIRDASYYNPAMQKAREDGLSPLGQYLYYDAIVMHGDGNDWNTFSPMVNQARGRATPPSRGGNEATFLRAFLDVRYGVMAAEYDHRSNLDRIEMQRSLLNAGKYNLAQPLSWRINGQQFTLNGAASTPGLGDCG